MCVYIYLILISSLTQKASPIWAYFRRAKKPPRILNSLGEIDLTEGFYLGMPPSYLWITVKACGNVCSNPHPLHTHTHTHQSFLSLLYVTVNDRFLASLLTYTPRILIECLRCNVQILDTSGLINSIILLKFFILYCLTAIFWPGFFNISEQTKRTLQKKLSGFS